MNMGILKKIRKAEWLKLKLPRPQTQPQASKLAADQGIKAVLRKIMEISEKVKGWMPWKIIKIPINECVFILIYISISIYLYLSLYIYCISISIYLLHILQFQVFVHISSSISISVTSKTEEPVNYCSLRQSNWNQLRNFSLRISFITDFNTKLKRAFTKKRRPQKRCSGDAL